MNEIKENNFFIPKKLAIGFNKRTNTYTGKLGYVTYYDNKNKLRKETSWNNWRNDNIDPLYIDNEAIEGFILNRSAGGGRGWDHRNTYARVWDPRGFEFEISIENLLWILDWCDCSAGKKLSGKFVYSWYGADLVLMPVISTDYKESIEITSKMFTKKSFKEKDLIPGTLYKFKGKTENDLIYIGKVKFAINFGNEFEEKLIFANKTEADKSRHYFHDYSLTINDLLYVKSPGSIIAEIQQNYISDEEVREYLHRFNISVYSQYFWLNIKDVVNKFIPTHPAIKDGYDEQTEVNYVNRKGQYPNDSIKEELHLNCTKFEREFKIIPDWAINNFDVWTYNSIRRDSALHLKADISNDGKYVLLKEPIYKMYTLHGYIRKCSEIRTMFDFASIDLTTGEIKKICDPGLIINGATPFSDNNIVNKYESETGDFDKACKTDKPIDVKDNRTFLYYITDDGYVSTGLQELLEYNTKLRFNTTKESREKLHAWEIPSVFCIPKKVND